MRIQLVEDAGRRRARRPADLWSVLVGAGADILDASPDYDHCSVIAVPPGVQALVPDPGFEGLPAHRLGLLADVRTGKANREANIENDRTNAAFIRFIA